MQFWDWLNIPGESWDFSVAGIFSMWNFLLNRDFVPTFGVFLYLLSPAWFLYASISPTDQPEQES